MGSALDEVFKPATIAIVTVSDTRALETDRSGTFLSESLSEAGHKLAQRKIVKDDVLSISQTLTMLLSNFELDSIILTGGTGLSARDVTLEALNPFFEKPIPGFGELFRMLSYEEIGPAAIQSRAEAGLIGNCVVFALPGSTGACRLALQRIILPQLDNTHKPCNFRTVIRS